MNFLIPIRPEWRSDTNSGVNFKTGKPQKEGESLLPMAIRNKKWMEHTCRDRQECNRKGCRNSQNKWKEQRRSQPVGLQLANFNKQYLLQASRVTEVDLVLMAC